MKIRITIIVLSMGIGLVVLVALFSFINNMQAYHAVNSNLDLEIRHSPENDTTTIQDAPEVHDLTVSAILTVHVIASSEENGTPPISGARVIVINSLGEIVASELTNAEGEASVSVTVPRDPRFPMLDMGVVTVIAVANGFNEHINFSVPINEYNNHTDSVSVPLWRIDPNRRNEPHFLNSSIHRFTAFEMLDHYANELGLERQEILFDIGKEPPWGPDKK